MECSSVDNTAPILSILICTLSDRIDKLNTLLEKLYSQADGYNVEFLTDSDNGESSIGEKRNRLLRKAKGEYVCYVDDDDDVSFDYIRCICKAVETKPDCVGIEGEIIGIHGVLKFFHSIEFQGWYTGIDGFYRTPNHLNPVKRNIVSKIMFKEISFGEDNYYSNALKHLIKTEEYIDHPIYIYKKDLDVVSC